MKQLDAVHVGYEEDPDVCFARIEQLVVELENVGETVSEMRLLVIVLTGLPDNYSCKLRRG